MVTHILLAALLAATGQKTGGTPGPRGPAGPAGAAGTALPGLTDPTAVTSFAGKVIGPDILGWVDARAFGVKCDGATDDTTAIQAAIDGACGSSSKGGTLAFPPGTCVVLGQLTWQTTGTITKVRQKSCRLVGAGASASGMDQPNLPEPNGGTIIDAQFNTTNAKILAVGEGKLEITGFTFTDSTAGSLPFILTTNTTLHIHDTAFVGSTSKSRTDCDQDAIILGGTNIDDYGGASPDAAFQGYGTVIRDNFFDHIRRAVWCRAWCNANVISGNTIWANAGSNLADGAAIDIDSAGNTTSHGTGNAVAFNTIEVVGYPYGIRVGGQYNTIIGNGMFDATGVNTAGVHIVAGENNTVLAPFSDNTVAVKDEVVLTSGISHGNSVYGQNTGRLSVGQYAPAVGDVLRIFAGGLDQAYAAFFPRKADRSVRGGYLGFSGDGNTVFTLQGEAGDLLLSAKAGGTVKIGAQYSANLWWTQGTQTLTANGTSPHFNISGTGAEVTLGATAFAALPASANGSIRFCSDCTIANPCAGSGGGAFAKRIAGAWVCN